MKKSISVLALALSLALFSYAKPVNSFRVSVACNSENDIDKMISSVEFKNYFQQLNELHKKITLSKAPQLFKKLLEGKITNEEKNELAKRMDLINSEGLTNFLTDLKGKAVSFSNKFKEYNNFTSESAKITLENAFKKAAKEINPSDCWWSWSACQTGCFICCFNDGFAACEGWCLFLFGICFGLAD